MSLPPTRVTASGPEADGPAADPFEGRLGELLGGKWRLEELLGVGGMAAVYGARHRVAENRVAVKILHPEVARVREARDRFEQEAQAIARLAHPGVVTILDIDVTERGESFLVMERLSGESLADRRARGVLPSAEVLEVADQTLEVLVAAHAMGIVHRDIKPDNLFMTAGGRLKVLDFGIARVRHESAMRVRTATGAALGTISYAPPEQLTGVGVDHRADIYALGATMFELATGRAIHAASNEQQLLVKMMTQPAPSLAEVSPHLPPDLCRVVDRALAFEADDRYPDAATMLADVRAVREGRPPHHAAQPRAAQPRATVMQVPAAAVTAMQAPAPAPHPPSRRLLAVALLSVLAGAVLVMLVASILDHEPEAATATPDDSRAKRSANEPDEHEGEGPLSTFLDRLGTGETDPADDEETERADEEEPEKANEEEGEKAREKRKKEEEKAREKRKKEEEKARKKRER